MTALPVSSPGFTLGTPFHFLFTVLRVVSLIIVPPLVVIDLLLGKTVDEVGDEAIGFSLGAIVTSVVGLFSYLMLDTMLGIYFLFYAQQMHPLFKWVPFYLLAYLTYGFLLIVAVVLMRMWDAKKILYWTAK